MPDLKLNDRYITLAQAKKSNGQADIRLIYDVQDNTIIVKTDEGDFYTLSSGGSGDSYLSVQDVEIPDLGTTQALGNFDNTTYGAAFYGMIDDISTGDIGALAVIKLEDEENPGEFLYYTQIFGTVINLATKGIEFDSDSKANIPKGFQLAKWSTTVNRPTGNNEGMLFGYNEETSMLEYSLNGGGSWSNINAQYFIIDTGVLKNNTGPVPVTIRTDNGSSYSEVNTTVLSSKLQATDNGLTYSTTISADNKSANLAFIKNPGSDNLSASLDIRIGPDNERAYTFNNLPTGPVTGSDESIYKLADGTIRSGAITSKMFMSRGAANITMNGTDLIFTFPHDLVDHLDAALAPNSISLTFQDGGNVELIQSLRTFDNTNVTLTCTSPPTAGITVIYFQVYG